MPRKQRGARAHRQHQEGRPAPCRAEIDYMTAWGKRSLSAQRSHGEDSSNSLGRISHVAPPKLITYGDLLHTYALERATEALL